jgi:DNA-binding response OmpR family regulator
MSYQLPVHPAYVSTTGSPSAQAKILIVEDELIVRRVLQRLLEQRGYAVTTAASAEEALVLLELEPFDLLLTDLHLGGSDGVALMVSARRRDPALEVIIISGCAKLASAIAAMRSGAYNYIVKPGQAGEIEDSIAAALAHRQQQLSGATMIYPSPPSAYSHLAEAASAVQGALRPAALFQPRARSLQIGELRIDIDRHQVSRGGERLGLSIIEFNLLVYLAERAEQVVTSKQLAYEVLGYRCDDYEARRLVKARIWSLRRRIEAQPSHPRLLLTIRGVGYRLTGEP